jgi:hypothetical protein
MFSRPCSRRLMALGVLFATTLAGCASWITYGDGDLLEDMW